MPFFWKKKKKSGEKKEVEGKIKRFTRLVADLNTKRDSLVQTGFPTSVAGLIVNSNISWIPPIPDRKKVSKKPYMKPPLNGSGPPFINPPVIHISTPVVDFDHPLRLEPGSVQLPLEESPTDTKPLDSLETDDLNLRKKKHKIIPLIFLLSVFTLVTKKLTLGVTTLAFLMFVIEHVNKRFFYSSNLCVWFGQMVKSKNEGSYKHRKSPLEGINICCSGGSSNHKREAVSVSPSMEMSVNDFLGRHENTGDLGSQRNEKMTLKQWMLHAEINGEESTPKMNPQNGLKAKLFKKCAIPSCSSKHGDLVERDEPVADEISVSDWLQDTHKIDTEKERFLDEGDSFPINTERNEINERFSIIWSLNLRNLISISVILSGLVGGRLVALLVTTTWYLLGNYRQLPRQRCKS